MNIQDSQGKIVRQNLAVYLKNSIRPKEDLAQKHKDGNLKKSVNMIDFMNYLKRR